VTGAWLALPASLIVPGKGDQQSIIKALGMSAALTNFLNKLPSTAIQRTRQCSTSTIC